MAEFFGNNIGRITTTGQITEFPVPVANSGPLAITVGPGGPASMVFTLTNINDVGEISLQGRVSLRLIPQQDGYNQGVTRGPDRAYWFTSTNGSSVVRIGVPI